jgi:hypothetical protein
MMSSLIYLRIGFILEATQLAKVYMTYTLILLTIDHHHISYIFKTTIKIKN